MKIQKYSSIQVFKYASIQVFKYSSIQVYSLQIGYGHITYNVKSKDPIGSKNKT